MICSTTQVTHLRHCKYFAVPQRIAAATAQMAQEAKAEKATAAKAKAAKVRAETQKTRVLTAQAKASTKTPGNKRVTGTDSAAKSVIIDLTLPE